MGHNLLNTFKKKADHCCVLTPDLINKKNVNKYNDIMLTVDKKLVNNFCNSHNCSSKILFLAAYYVVMTKFISEDNLLFAMIDNLKSLPRNLKMSTLIDYCLPIDLYADRDNNIKDLLDICKKTLSSVEANSDATFSQLANTYNILPETFFYYHELTDYSESVNYYLTYRSQFEHNIPDFKLAVLAREFAKSYRIRIFYHEYLYSRNYIKSFIKSMYKVINLWAQTDITKMKIKDIELADREVNYEFTDINNTSIKQRFEEAVEKWPNKTVVSSCGEHVTYKELNKRANIVANNLIDLGVTPGDRIIYQISRNVDLYSIIFGIIKAHAIFIPLDLDLPKERTKYIIENSQSHFIITDCDYEKAIKPSEILYGDKTSNPPLENYNENDILYIIYTSGSTGQPKGVPISNKNIANLCESDPQNNYFHTRKVKPESVLICASVSFDVFMLDTFTSILNGIAVFLANDEEIKDVFLLCDFINKENPEILGFMTPSRLLQYLQVPQFCELYKNFSAVAVGGEVFLPSVYDESRKYSNLDIYNGYGPTETTCICNAKIVSKNDYGIGPSLYNVICDVRDIDKKILPNGVIGELYIGGAGVSQGYYNLKGRANDSFMQIDCIPYYKSGDYAKKLDNGDFIVYGRRDGQIKLRGLRIEIEDIEKNILTFKDINSVAVVVKKVCGVDHLCAYYTTSDNKDVSIQELKNHLSKNLTDYMIPTFYEKLDEMPRTVSDKIDKLKLPEPHYEKKFVKHSNDEEKFYCNLFSKVLKLEKVGATDNFFEIGGNSLLATQIILEAKDQGRKINYKDIFNNPTPRMLSNNAGELVSNDKIADIIKSLDYTQIHHYLKNNNFDNYLKDDKFEIKDVILTGVTGFLGIHVLQDLIENYDCNIHCIIRKTGDESCLNRLVNKMNYYFGDKYNNLIEKRVIIHQAEITQKNCFKDLNIGDINLFINCAASVKHYAAGNNIYKINVKAVKNCLKFAVNNNIRFIQISTESTAGEYLTKSPIEHLYDEQILYRGQLLDNKYMSSKFISEAVVLDAAEKGYDVKVIRLGNLMARSTDGLFQDNYTTNDFISQIKAYVTLKCISYTKILENIELSQVDATSQAIVKLAKTPRQCCLFNCINNHNITFGDIIDVLNNEGFDIDVVTPAVFTNKLKDTIKDQNKQGGIQGLFTKLDSDGDSGRMIVPIDHKYTNTVLAYDKFFWPTPSKEYISKFVKFLDSKGFWD